MSASLNTTASNQRRPLTDAQVRAIALPARGNRISYDSEVMGFGVRVTSAGARAFVLNYRAKGRERRITIGSFPDWGVRAAREEAKALKRRIDQGFDPMGERQAERTAPTMNDLADKFDEEHVSRRRPATQRDYRSILRLYVRPQLGTMKVVDVRHADVDRLQRRIACTAPYRANRTASVLSKMFTLAIKWEICTHNPARGIERSPEEKRDRFLSVDEIGRLAGALAAHPERASANAVRLLLLTGARKAEVLTATWTQFDLAAGVWTKPSAHTKQKKEHRVPLPASAVMLLEEMRAEAEDDLRKARKLKADAELCPFLFPSTNGKPLRDVKHFWTSVCIKAGLAQEVEKRNDGGCAVRDKQGKPVMVWQSTARIHDLRHTYASVLVSSGLSLPIVGALLGHTQPATTARYAHLADAPLRSAVERGAAILAASGRKQSP